MAKQIRLLFSDDEELDLLDDTVEVDETYVGGKRKGKRGRGAGRGGTRGGTTSASRKRSANDDSYFKKPKLDSELFGDSSDTDSTEESEIDDRKKDRDYRPWK